MSAAPAETHAITIHPRWNAASDAAGVWGQRYDELEDLNRARRLPSPQLAGTPERMTLDLNALTDLGVQLVGKWAAVRDERARELMVSRFSIHGTEPNWAQAYEFDIYLRGPAATPFEEAL